MILDFNVNFNNYEEKIINFNGIWDYSCPCCKAFRPFSRHATYSRNICFFEYSKIIEKKTDILRLKCSSCLTTHAILPADIIPYKIYSFSCIMNILKLLYVDGMGVLDIAKKLNITFQLIYSFIKVFKKFMAACISFLKIFSFAQLDFGSSCKDILVAINEFTDLVTFQRNYFDFTQTVFLMDRNLNTVSGQITIGSHFKPPT